MPLNDAVLESRTEVAAATAVRKFEKFYIGLDDSERAVVGEMVHAALLHAANGPLPVAQYVWALKREAPSLIDSITEQGSVVAYNHTNCILPPE